jgi:hypothetical protein
LIYTLISKFSSLSQMLASIFYSFPVQLLLYNIKKNQILLFYWLMLFGFVTGMLGKSFGGPYLFLDPEYLNQVNFWSLYILGFTVGGFIMAFNITCFILDSYRFSFLSMLPKPFMKYCINNGVIPLLFLIVYLASFISFQLDYEFNTVGNILWKAFGFIAGVVTVIVVFIVYFRLTNKDVFFGLAKNVDKTLRRNKIHRVNVMGKINQAKRNRIRVDNLLDNNLRVIKTEDYFNYDKETVLKVFDYYHLNAVIIELIILILILVLGIFRDEGVFQLPAAASVLLLFIILVMISGALSYWSRGWSFTIIVALLLIFNYAVKFDFINSRNEAFGLNYKTEKADYSLQTINNLSPNHVIRNDKQEVLAILNAWKAKQKEEKPKIIFVTVSGGGQRSALWTLNTLQTLDKRLQGKLFANTVLITGASGGLIGASYFREIYLRKLRGENIDLYDKKYLTNISKDNLNPVIFSMVVSNPLIGFQKYEYAGYKYVKDRGYAFEQQINKNMEGFLDKTLSAYRIPEKTAEIPLLIMSPIIINDGRKLYISAQPISFMTTVDTLERSAVGEKVKGIEFSRFFKNQNADSLRYLSALRMSATFPYITPNINLPSNPPMEIMDAGLADNYGVSDAVKFISEFKEWINENTSRVIILSIRDTEKDTEIEKNVRRSFFTSLFSPIGSLYTNWDNLQDINNDNSIELLKDIVPNLHRIDFEYRTKTTPFELFDKNSGEIREKAQQSEDRKVSLSWRLTATEKDNILKNVNAFHIHQSMQRLDSLLKN